VDRKERELISYVIIAILILIIIFDNKNNEQIESKEEEYSSHHYVVPGSSEDLFNREVEAAGGWDAYELRQRKEACFDSCDGYDDPWCEFCASLE